MGLWGLGASAKIALQVYNATEMTAEPAFLIAAVRHFLDAEAPLPDAENVDWASVLRLANAHTVAPMLYTAFREVPIPDGVAEHLRSAFETSARWSLAQSGELTRLVRIFEEKGIPVVALKAPRSRGPPREWDRWRGRDVAERHGTSGATVQRRHTGPPCGRCRGPAARAAPTPPCRA